MHNKFYFFCLLFLGFVACQRNVSKNLAAPTSNVIVPDSEIFELSQAYQDDMKKWQNDRFESVTAPHGWLSVIGLHWLKEGENKMGSGNNNDIVLPELASNYVGSIFLHDGKIRFKAYPESYVSLGYDNAFQQGEMKTDADGDPTVLNHQSLFFHVIKRGGQYGVRLKNTLARARFDLKEIPYFSLNPAMVFDAVTVPTSTMDSIEIRDVLGEVKNYSLESKLLFKRNGEICYFFIYSLYKIRFFNVRN